MLDVIMERPIVDAAVQRTYWPLPDEESASSRQPFVVYLERLMVLPLPEWVTAATAPCGRGAETASHTLTLALSAEALWNVWSLRDDVETACFRFECPEGRMLTRRRGRLRAVRAGTERAALCLLARARLADAVLVELYGGFEQVIPRGKL
jgi:hypothetical protein